MRGQRAPSHHHRLGPQEVGRGVLGEARRSHGFRVCQLFEELQQGEVVVEGGFAVAAGLLWAAREVFVLVDRHDSYDLCPIPVIFGVMLSNLDIEVERILSISAMSRCQDEPIFRTLCESTCNTLIINIISSTSC